MDRMHYIAQQLLWTLCLVLSLGIGKIAQANNYTIEINKGSLVKLEKQADTIVVANPDIADVQVVTPHLVYISGRSVGETSVIVIGEGENVLMQANINVTHNLGRLKSAVSSAMPNSKVVFDSTNNGITLKGHVESPVVAEKIQRMAASFLGEDQSVINMLQTEGGDQVMLKVKIAEVSRTELKRFGINLSAILSTGNFVFGVATGRPIFDAAGAVLRSTQLDNNLLGSYNNGSTNINGLIDALGDDGLVTILAEPNLTSKSGMTANFLAGGEFPIPVVGEEGSVTVEYRRFGVSLDFTPVVLDGKKISLTVSPEVSSLSALNSIQANGFNIPTLLTRRASTTVELGSGETFAVAGLLRHDNSNDVSKVPGLGDVPVLGALFRSTEFRNDMTELVILVTPYIVQGTSEAKLATPTDGYKPVSDMERVLMGKLYANKEKDAEEENTPTQAKLHGPAGFIMR